MYTLDAKGMQRVGSESALQKKEEATTHAIIPYMANATVTQGVFIIFEITTTLSPAILLPHRLHSPENAIGPILNGYDSL